MKLRVTVDHHTQGLSDPANRHTSEFRAVSAFTLTDSGLTLETPRGTFAKPLGAIISIHADGEPLPSSGTYGD